MTSCPICLGTRIFIALTERRPASGRCLACGARWLQDGSTQRAVRPSLVELLSPRRARRLQAIPRGTE